MQFVDYHEITMKAVTIHELSRRICFFVGVVLLGSAPAMGQQWAGSGITEAFLDVTLSSVVAGRIVSIAVAEGDAVQKDQTLLELDHSLESLEVQRRMIVWESQVDLESAAQQLKLLKEDLDGSRALYDGSQSISREDLRQKELQTIMAQAEYDRLVIGEKREEIEHEIAVAQLERRFVKAPFSGIVVEVHLQESESANPQEPLVRIIDISQCRLVMYLDVGIARSLDVNEIVNIRIELPEGQLSQKGRVEYISPLVDPASNYTQVKIVFENSDGAVTPGLIGRLELES